MSKPSYRVAVALVQREGTWLVARRRADAHLGGSWEFPGGKCECDEAPSQTAIRELREECGVQARCERALAPISHDYGDRIVTITPVLCTWVAGDGRPIGSEECRWVTPAELRRLEMPALNAAILRAIVPAE